MEKDKDVVVDTMEDCPPTPPQAEVDLLACKLSLFTEQAEMLRRNLEIAMRNPGSELVGDKQKELVKNCFERLLLVNQRVAELLNDVK